jgi:hypothetical protein
VTAQPMKPEEITAAREALGRRWRLGRAITLGELGMLLRLAPGSSWKTVEDWETGRRPPSGPVSVAIELMVAGADPEHLADVLKPNKASMSPRGPHGLEAGRWGAPPSTDFPQTAGDGPQGSSYGRARGHTAEFAEADRVVDAQGRVLKDRDGPHAEAAPLVDFAAVSARLAAARQAAGFEQPHRAALQFGWRRETYMAHESGRLAILPKALREYAEAFNVDQRWLLRGDKA